MPGIYIEAIDRAKIESVKIKQFHEEGTVRLDLIGDSKTVRILQGAPVPMAPVAPWLISTGTTYRRFSRKKEIWKRKEFV